MTIQVEVTSEDIVNGLKGSAIQCPVAKAISRFNLGKYIIVGKSFDQTYSVVILSSLPESVKVVDNKLVLDKTAPTYEKDKREYTSKNLLFKVDLPELVCHWLRTFDKGDSVRPISFPLELIHPKLP